MAPRNASGATVIEVSEGRRRGVLVDNLSSTVAKIDELGQGLRRQRRTPREKVTFSVNDRPLVSYRIAVTLLVTASGILSRSVQAQQPAAAATSLVFDGVTVVDVEQGRHLTEQRVLISGARIQAVGRRAAIKVPKDARVVDTRGQYLIPGLWDLHTHPRGSAPNIFYPLFVANGVTGIRDAGSEILLDTLRQWRREILAGTRVGPPRQILSGPPIGALGALGQDCYRFSNDVPPGSPSNYYTCVSPGQADADHLVDSLRAAGVDMIKTYAVAHDAYMALASAARRAGIPIGGHAFYRRFHLGVNDPILAAEAADSGVAILDHVNSAGGLDLLCVWRNKLYPPFPDRDADEDPEDWSIALHDLPDSASLPRCQALAERMRRSNTWWVPTVLVYDDGVGKRGQLGTWEAKRIRDRLTEYARAYWSGKVLNPYAPEYTGGAPAYATSTAPDSLRLLTLVQQASIPVLAGTDAVPEWLRTVPPGFALHAEMAAGVAEGLTPLTALQSATLNPAKMLHATDSLGTVAAGKLADLVLLDADPLADIANTTRIRAVVANGRYYDRVALDELLVQAQQAARSHNRDVMPQSP